MSIEGLYRRFLLHPRISTDSRSIRPGDLFFALRGDRFDGNRYASAALAAGASLAVVDDPALKGKEGHLLVDDALQTLQALATHHRRQTSVPVIGITGSNGKTTTKELVKAVLDTTYRVHCTAGNLNNHIGVPLTLLAMAPKAELAIIEMGANHQGEIDQLSRIAEPTHGLITNIGKAHLEGFGGIEGVKRGKSELYRFLAERDGVAFVNVGERFLVGLSEPVRHRVFYGPADYEGPEQLAVSAACRATEPFVVASFPDRDGREVTVRSQLPGEYNFNNILTAIALGIYFKVPSSRIRAAIEAYVPHGNRSVVRRRGGITLIQDAYNANPTSMRFALDNLARRKEPVKWAILGDMLELGQDAEAEHQAIADHAAALGIDRLVLIGPLFARVQGKGRVEKWADAAEAIPWLEKHLPKEVCVLVKGSRGLRLERLWASGPLRKVAETGP